MSGIKSILFLLITSLTFIKSSAQQSNANTVPARRIDAVEANPAFACVKYQFTHIYDTLNPKSPDIKEMSLFIGKNSSKYVEDRIYNSVMPIVTVATNSEYSELSEQLNSLNNQSLGIYKNYGESRISIVDIVKENLSLIEEDLDVINWKITTISKDIKGFKCLKAVGDYKGRTYEAWFCKEYPYSTGPWKLGGLPGLIIEASDLKNQVEFSFIGYEKLSANTTDISLPKSINKTGLDEYKKILDSFIVYQSGDKKFKVMDDGTGNPLRENLFQGMGGGGLKKITINNPVELK